MEVGVEKIAANGNEHCQNEVGLERELFKMLHLGNSQI